MSETPQTYDTKTFNAHTDEILVMHDEARAAEAARKILAGAGNELTPTRAKLSPEEIAKKAGAGALITLGLVGGLTGVNHLLGEAVDAKIAYNEEVGQSHEDSANKGLTEIENKIPTASDLPPALSE